MVGNIIDIKKETPTKEYNPITPGTTIAPPQNNTPPIPNKSNIFEGLIVFINAVPIHLPVKKIIIAVTLKYVAVNSIPRVSLILSTYW